MIDQRLKSIDQDKKRQEMQEQAKQRAFCCRGVEPAAECQVFYFIMSIL